MYIRLVILLSSLFMTISVQAEMIIKYEKEGFFDRSWFENKKQITERNVFLTSKTGVNYTTKQRFIVIDHNTLEYIPDSSSPDTLKYIREICEKYGMKPAPEPKSGLSYQRISMKTSFGMSCASTEHD